MTSRTWMGRVADPPVGDADQSLVGSAAAGQYDPGEGTVDEVLEYAADHPDEVSGLIAREKAGKGRKGILDSLSEPTE